MRVLLLRFMLWIEVHKLWLSPGFALLEALVAILANLTVCIIFEVISLRNTTLKELLLTVFQTLIIQPTRFINFSNLFLE